MEPVVQIFKALGDETRLKILIIMVNRKICAKGIARHLDISEAAVSQHLKVLREAGIIVGEKFGYHMRYNLQEAALKDIVSFIEHLNVRHVTNRCSSYASMPNYCKAECKTARKKCCENNKEREV